MSIPKIQEIKQKILRKTEERLDWLISLCESPIEKQFLLGLYNSFNEVYNDEVEFLCREVIPENEGTAFARLTEPYQFREAGSFLNIIGMRLHYGSYRMEVFPQYKTACEDVNYRLDFAIFCYNKRHREKGVVKYDVECDGWEYHESRKDRERDNFRDSALQREGWKTLRYLGTTLYTDLEKCVNDCADTIIFNLSSISCPSGCCTNRTFRGLSEFDPEIEPNFKKIIIASYK